MQVEMITNNYKINNALNDNEMKKKFTLVTLTLLIGLFSWNVNAATGWYEDYVKINVNNAGLTGPTGYYWIGTNPSWATSFVNGLGTVTSLKLDGADMKYWSDTQDRTGGSMFYQVTSADGLTTYIAATEAIWSQTFLGGNNYQGMSSGLNVDLLAGIPAGTACKLTVWAKSWGSGQGDSWLTNSGANYSATFTTASILLTGATGINNTRYTTLKGAFDAINANTSGVNTDDITIKVGDNTTETATAVLNPSKGVNTLTTAAGSGYQAPVITLTGGTTSGNGSVTTTITNGVITSIIMTGGTWTAAPTVSIALPAGGGTRATATASGTSGNQTFTITNGGTNYGPSATFSGGGGTGAAVNVIMTTVATAVIGASSPRTVTPATVGLTYTLTCPGSGYTSNPTCAISAFAGATAGTVSVASLYPSIEYNSLVVYPTVASKTISGTALNLISISGRKNVTIDGRVNRTGTPIVGHSDNLTISTTSTNYVILLNNNCQNDTVKYCTLKGSATGSQGIIQLGSGASLSNGNGLNVIDKNLITNNGTIPQYSIYSIGSSAFPNVGNKITNNEFKDVIATGAASTNIYMLGGVTSPQNDNFTISGNSFYSFNSISSNNNSTRTVIAIGASATTFGGSHTIMDNYIGGSAASCVGTLTKTGTNCSFNGIVIYPSPSVSGGGATSIQNNTIKNISWTNGGFGNNCIMLSIPGGTGAVNIGTVTGNSIGDNTTTGSIVISQSSSSASTIGINIGTTGTVDCRNNKIGSITTSNVTAGFNSTTYAIQKTSSAGNVTISNNIIGSTTAANSITVTCPSLGTLTANLTQAVAGINCNGTGTNIINNNTIANLTNTITGTLTNVATFAATNNLYGITCSGTSSNNTINNNVINTLSTSITDLMVVNQFGIYLNATTSNGTVNGNLIHSNTISGYNSGGGALIGIQSNLGTNTITNNIVKLGDANACHIRGIADVIGSNIYHNTVYISGEPTSGTLTSSSLYCGATTNRNYRNNILVNTRSNMSPASGEHYAFSTTSATATGINLDGNNYYVTGTNGKLGKIGTDPSQDTKPFFIGQDAASVIGNPLFANAGGITADSFMPYSSSITGVDLSATITTDYNGLSRSTTPTMGALDYATWNGTAWNTEPTTNYNAKINGTFTGAGFACRNLVLNAGKQLSISSGVLAVANNFTILSDASNGTGTFIDNGGTLSVLGTTTVNQSLQHYLSGTLRTWYLTPPVASATPSGMSIIKSYDEATYTWSSSLTTMNAKVGYQVVPALAANNISFTGALNTGNQNISLTSRTGIANKAGFNLIGNPYPSYLDWTLVTANAANTALMRSTTMWYRTKSDAGTYNFWTVNGDGVVSPNGANSKIPPMQAFWVRANAGGGTLALTNDMRSHAPVADKLLKAPTAKNTANTLVRLQVSNGTNTDEAVLYFSANASNGLDSYDAPKMSNENAAIPEIYTTLGDEQIVINGMNTIPLDAPIGLGFVAGNASSFSLFANEVSNLPSGIKLILKDNVTNAETDLTDGIASYQFSPVLTSSDRFSVIFRTPGAVTSVENPHDNSILVYNNAPQQLTVICNDLINLGSMVSVYNALGQKLISQKQTSTSMQIAGKFIPGVYVVKVNNTTKKVIIN